MTSVIYSLLPLERVRTELSDFFGEAGDNFGKSRSFRGGDPFDEKAFGVDPQTVEYDLDRLSPCQCFVITVQVMTFAQVSPHDHDAVCSFGQRMSHKIRVHHAGAHHPNGPHIGRILKA